MLPYRLAGLFLKVSRGSWVRLRMRVGTEREKKGSRGKGGLAFWVARDVSFLTCSVPSDQKATPRNAGVDRGRRAGAPCDWQRRLSPCM